MSILALRVFDRNNTADLTRLPAYRSGGSGLISRIAAAGILRFAFGLPAVYVILSLSMVAARIISGRRPPTDNSRPVLRARECGLIAPRRGRASPWVA
jgi:hypothetical protein